MNQPATSEEIASQLESLRKEVENLRAEIGPTEGDRLLTKEQVAKILNVSKRTVATLIADDQIPSIKVRRCRRVPREGLESYIRRKAGGR